MKIFILDDDPLRHLNFSKRFDTWHEVVHAYTTEEAGLMLTKLGPFDVCYLDHDLNDYGKHSMVATGYGMQELTGFDVARFIARELAVDKRPTRVVVHSWNPPGARMMVEILQEVGIPTTYEPFQADAEDDISDLTEQFNKE